MVSHVCGAPDFRPTGQTPPSGATPHSLRVGWQLRKKAGERLRAEDTPEPHFRGPWAPGVKERTPSAAGAGAGSTRARQMARGAEEHAHRSAPRGEAGRRGQRRYPRLPLPAGETTYGLQASRGGRLSWPRPKPRLWPVDAKAGVPGSQLSLSTL